MSDYISKSAVIEKLRKDKESSANVFNGVDMLQAEDILCELEILIDNQPTISETEIIRKAFERVVERLREKGTWKSSISNDMIYSPRKNITVEEAIKIVKEECGISE